MKYFNHDIDASRDEKILALRIKAGGAAVDAYWAIIEKIYEGESPVALSADLPGTVALAHILCTDPESLVAMAGDMCAVGLLVPVDGDALTVDSPRARQNLDGYHRKADRARANGGRVGTDDGERRCQGAGKSAPTVGKVGTDDGDGRYQEGEKSVPTTEGVGTDGEESRYQGATESVPTTGSVGTDGEQSRYQRQSGSVPTGDEVGTDGGARRYQEGEKSALKVKEKEKEKEERGKERVVAKATTPKKAGSRPRPRSFSPPSVEEVAGYAEGQGWDGFDARRFCDYYESNGWMVGKNRMRDWQAAARNWHGRDGKGAANANPYSGAF